MLRLVSAGSPPLARVRCACSQVMVAASALVLPPVEAAVPVPTCRPARLELPAPGGACADSSSEFRRGLVRGVPDPAHAAQRIRADAASRRDHCGVHTACRMRAPTRIRVRSAAPHGGTAHFAIASCVSQPPSSGLRSGVRRGASARSCSLRPCLAPHASLRGSDWRRRRPSTAHRLATSGCRRRRA